MPLTADLAALPQNVDPLPPELVVSPQKAQSNWISSFGLLLIAAGLSILLEFLRPSWAGILFQPMKLNTFAGLSATVTAFFGSIALHEFGHLAAALAVRFEVMGITLGPLRLTRLHGKTTLQFSPRTWFMGSVSAAPRNTTSWRPRMLVVIAGGPAATLLSGVASGAALRYFPANDWLHLMLSTLMALSFLTFVLGLVPNGVRAQLRSDAQLFHSILRRTAEAREIYTYHLLTQLKISGTRPRDYPADVIGSLATPWSRPDMSLLCADTITLWALDRGSIETADAWDRRALELSPSCDSRLQNLARAKSACYDVLFRADFVSAKAKFARSNIQAITPLWLQHRIRAAQCIAENRTSDAIAAISQCKRAFPKPLPYYEFEEKLLNLMFDGGTA